MATTLQRVVLLLLVAAMIVVLLLSFTAMVSRAVMARATVAQGAARSTLAGWARC